MEDSIKSSLAGIIVERSIECGREVEQARKMQQEPETVAARAAVMVVGRDFVAAQAPLISGTGAGLDEHNGALSDEHSA